MHLRLISVLFSIEINALPPLTPPLPFINFLQTTTDWSASTIKTLIARMAEKGIVRFEGDRPRLYFPNIQKEDAAFSETQQLLSKAFGGNFGLLMSNFIDNAKLSKSDLEELYDMLRQAEEGL